MIIIEGMDNTGKTTLVESIRAAMPMLRLVPSEGPKERDAMMLRCVNGMLDPYSVFDRYHLFSEWVYGPPVRGACKFSGHWTQLAYLTLLNLPVVIYCRPDDEKILAFDDRAQMPGVREKSLELIQRYDRVMEYFYRLVKLYGMGAVVRYDYTLMEPSGVITFLDKYIESKVGLMNELKELARESLNETDSI